MKLLKIIKDSEQTLTKLKAVRDSMLKVIKEGDKSLYSEYIKIVADTLKLESDLSKLKALIK